MPIQKNQRNFLGNALDSFDSAVSIRPLNLIFWGIILISAAVLITYVSLALKLNGGSQQANNFQPQPITSDTPTKIPSIIPTTGDFIGWKTYTDATENYSFKYPGDWYFRSGNPNQLYNYNVDSAPGRSPDPELDKNDVKIEMWTTQTAYSETVDRYLAENPPGVYGQEVAVEFSEISIDNQKALKGVSNRGLIILEVYVKNPITGRIHTITASPRYDLHQDSIDQILSTFRFLDSDF